MSLFRNAAGDLGIRPLTARSVLLSTLLGLDPPVLPGHRLVATAGLFGITENAARVALSRMTAAGELVAEDGRYRLADRFLARQRRQESGRHPTPRRWSGAWHVLVIASGRRPAHERAELRAVLRDGRLAEWREGVWTRPANVPKAALPDHLSSWCTWVEARPDTDAHALAAHLWDLEGHARVAAGLTDRLQATRRALGDADVSVLGPGFVLSAAVLRHLAADPLLPVPLLPPHWPNDALRVVYDDWDRAYRAVLAKWHRAGPRGGQLSAT